MAPGVAASRASGLMSASVAIMAIKKSPGSGRSYIHPGVAELPDCSIQGNPRQARLPLHIAAKGYLFTHRKSPRLPTGLPLGFAHMTGRARYPPRLSREGKLELTKGPRSPDRGCGNSRRFPPGDARADRSGRSGSEARRHPAFQEGVRNVECVMMNGELRGSAG